MTENGITVGLIWVRKQIVGAGYVSGSERIPLPVAQIPPKSLFQNGPCRVRKPVSKQTMAISA
jgi:hypothetical protein